MAEVLQSATAYDGTTKTKIMFRAVLTSEQAKEYINPMVKNGLLELRPPKLYKTTEKGWQFLMMNDQLAQCLKIQ